MKKDLAIIDIQNYITKNDMDVISPINKAIDWPDKLTTKQKRA
ncbi:hypothetical protein ACIZ62_18090 [Acetobacterium carbinolicum]|jgi:hypothetical protein|nr:hypothetical protein [Acetobacterium sp. K1/6]MDZ5726673.1 hypothetical protein [Acetobacterium sp. K1/6]